MFALSSQSRKGKKTVGRNSRRVSAAQAAAQPRSDFKRQGEVEGGALIELAFGPDAAAVELDEPAADVQAQPQALLVARRGRGLVKTPEQKGKLLRGDADAGV